MRLAKCARHVRVVDNYYKLGHEYWTFLTGDKRSEAHARWAVLEAMRVKPTEPTPSKYAIPATIAVWLTGRGTLPGAVQIAEDANT